MAMSETKSTVLRNDSIPRTDLAAGVHAERVVARVPALATIAFGLVVLFCVGFLQVSAVHNGAHDTRHANGFPCH
jgi:cobalt transporter subunit CbtB